VAASSTSLRLCCARKLRRLDHGLSAQCIRGARRRFSRRQYIEAHGRRNGGDATRARRAHECGGAVRYTFQQILLQRKKVYDRCGAHITSSHLAHAFTITTISAPRPAPSACSLARQVQSRKCTTGAGSIDETPSQHLVHYDVLLGHARDYDTRRRDRRGRRPSDRCLRRCVSERGTRVTRGEELKG